MKTILKSLIAVLAIAGAALAVPALASAETFCVNAAAACPAGGNDFGDLQDAMNAAATQDGDDEILLGDKQTPYFGPFVYDPVSTRFNRLTLKGVGGRPSLTAPVGDTVLSVRGASLQNLAIVTDFGEGAGPECAGSDVKDVKVKGPGFLAPDLSGIFASGTTLEDVEITGGYEPRSDGRRRPRRHRGRGSQVEHPRRPERRHLRIPHFGDIELSDSRVSGEDVCRQLGGLREDQPQPADDERPGLRRPEPIRIARPVGPRPRDDRPHGVAVRARIRPSGFRRRPLSTAASTPSPLRATPAASGESTWTGRLRTS